MGSRRQGRQLSVGESFVAAMPPYVLTPMRGPTRLAVVSPGPLPGLPAGMAQRTKATGWLGLVRDATASSWPCCPKVTGAWSTARAETRFIAAPTRRICMPLDGTAENVSDALVVATGWLYTNHPVS